MAGEPWAAMRLVGEPSTRWRDLDRSLEADHLQRKAGALAIDQIVVEDVYSQSEKRLRPALVLYFRETKKVLVLSGTTQNALQALLGTTRRPASASGCSSSRRQCASPAGSASPQ